MYYARATPTQGGRASRGVEADGETSLVDVFHEFAIGSVEFDSFETIEHTSDKSLLYSIKL